MQTLKSIPVQANKVEQNIWDVDGNIDVITGNELERINIRDTKSLNRILPSIHISETSSKSLTNASIRGISSNDFFNPSLVIYLDGIPIDSSLLSFPLVNIQSLELLKGPQGTLWGQNAQGGVLNIIQKQVEEDISFRLTGDASNLENKLLLSSNIPLIDNYLYAQGNIYVSNFSGNLLGKTNKDYLNKERTTIGDISLKLHPKESGFNGIFKWSKNISVGNKDGTFVDRSVYYEQQIEEKIHFTPYTNLVFDTYALKLKYDANDDHSIQNIISFSDRIFHQIVSYGNWKERKNTLTNELRYNYKIDGGGYVVAGIYFQMIKTLHDIVGSYLGRHDTTYGVNKYQIALFSESRFTLMQDVLNMTIGIRYNIDRSIAKSPGAVLLNAGNNSNNGSAYKQYILDSFNNKYIKHAVIPKVALSYYIDEDNKLYSSYTIGYKPGGFNMYLSTMKDTESFNGEYSHNAELGYSGYYNNEMFNLNLSLFYMYTQNYQSYVGILGTQTLRNVGGAISYGTEIGLKINLEQVSIGLYATIVKGSYASNALDDITNTSLAKNSLVVTPLAKGNINVSYNFININDWKLYFNINGFATSKYFFTQDNKTFQEAHIILDASFEMVKDDDFSFTAYINNFTNTRSASYIFSYVNGLTYQYGPLLQYGVKLSAHF